MVQIRTLATAQGTEHENTTTEGSIATHAFAAGSLTPGKIYAISGGMTVVDNNSTDTLTLALRFGSSDTVGSNTSCGASAAVDAVDADYACIRAELHVQTATRAVMLAWVQAPDATGVEAVYAHTTVLTIDQDTAYRVDWTADWSVAHADNECASEAWAVLEIA